MNRTVQQKQKQIQMRCDVYVRLLFRLSKVSINSGVCGAHMRWWCWWWCSKSYNIRDEWDQSSVFIYIRISKVLSFFLFVCVCVRVCVSVVFLLMFSVGWFFLLLVMPNCYRICDPVSVRLLLFKIISFKFKYSEISLSLWFTFRMYESTCRVLIPVLWLYCYSLPFFLRSHIAVLYIVITILTQFIFIFCLYVSKLSRTSFSRCTRFASYSKQGNTHVNYSKSENSLSIFVSTYVVLSTYYVWNAFILIVTHLYI